MFARKILWFVLLCSGLAIGGRAEPVAAFPERKTFQFGEFFIEASLGDEAYVEALAVKLADFKPEIPAPPPPLKLGLDDLQKRRDYFLRRITAYLGLAQPTEKMASIYDLTVKLWRTLRVAAPKGALRHYALWRKPELVARIQAGQKIPGFTLSPSGDLDFSFKFNGDYGADASSMDHVAAGIADFWSTFVLPIKIGATPDTTPAAEVSAGLEGLTSNIFNSFGAQMQVTERQIVFNVLHETTESGIVWHYLTSKDRRWFCDGVANYVAWRIMEQEVGKQEVLAYYDLEAELKKYQGESARVDLAAWPAAEDPGSGSYAEDLNTANYAFATKVIADICARYKAGDDLLPKLFEEIGKTPREKATMETVYKAYRKLTKGDLRTYLPNPVEHK
jgi:hypothetical protein